MNPNSKQLASTQPWREQAIDTVVERLHLLHPDLAERFGARGVRACREDIRYHLDYLDSALVTGEAKVFTKYAVWLRDVLANRGVLGSHLVESFDLLAEYLAGELTEPDAAQVSAIFAAAKSALAREDVHASYSQTRVAALPESIAYRKAALNGNRRLAAELMHVTMQQGCGLCEASVRLIQPAMYEVGRLWQENQITVAQEHLATAISQDVIADAYLHADFSPPIGRKAMLACVAGNQHRLGLRMLSDAFETIGWGTAYLGAEVPSADLIRQVDASRPDLLCLSLSMPSQLAATRETIDGLRVELGTRCPTIWVGGQFTLAAPSIWRLVKADGWASDAMHALEQVAA